VRCAGKLLAKVALITGWAACGGHRPKRWAYPARPAAVAHLALVDRNSRWGWTRGREKQRRFGHGQAGRFARIHFWTSRMLAPSSPSAEGGPQAGHGPGRKIVINNAGHWLGRAATFPGNFSLERVYA